MSVASNWHLSTSYTREELAYRVFYYFDFFRIKGLTLVNLEACKTKMLEFSDFAALAAAETLIELRNRLHR